MADVAMLLTDDPQQAIDKMNEHSHDGALGKPIGTEGIEDYAVTEPKMADESVSTRTIQPGAVGMDKLDTEVKDMISAGGAEGVPGLTNFIAEGLKIVPGTGLSITLQPGRASISEKTLKLTAAINLALGPRMASLIYAQKQADSDIPIVSKVDAISPLTTIDNNTLGMWLFNQVAAGANVPNSAVGASSIAVSCDLVPSGGLSSVDGHTDYAIKFDGSTGCYVGSNVTNFPIGAAEREDIIKIITAAIMTSGNRFYFARGGTSTGTAWTLYRSGKRLYISIMNTIYDTKFDLEASSVYRIGVGYKDGKLIIRVNFYTVFTVAVSVNTSTGNIYIGRPHNTAANYCEDTICELEMRTSMRSDADEASICNRMLLPCQYRTQYQDEYINGIKMYDISTPENAISGGDFSGLQKENAYDKNISSRWGSGQQGTSISGNAFIGQKVSSKIKRIRYTTYSGATSNINSALIRYSTDDGATWNTIQTQTMVTTANTTVDFDVADYPVTVPHRIILLANSNLGSGISWSISEIQMFTDIKPADYADIRKILPADSNSLGFTRTDSTKIIAVDSDGYKYGRREKAIGGNRKKQLEWKYVNSGEDINFVNPFGTENISIKEIWFKKNISDCQHSVVDTVYTTGYYGVFVNNVTPSTILLKVGAGGIVVPSNSYTGNTETAGYIAIITEVME